MARKVCSECREVIQYCDKCFKPFHEKNQIRCDESEQKHYCLKCKPGEPDAEVEILD